MDDGERVQPWLLPGLRRLRRWQHGHMSHHAVRQVTLGRLADGRWLAENSDVIVGSDAYRSRESAEQRITDLMWDGDWIEIPAGYDAAANPLGEGWVRRGGGWVRDAPSEDAADDR